MQIVQNWCEKLNFKKKKHFRLMSTAYWRLRDASSRRVTDGGAALD